MERVASLIAVKGHMVDENTMLCVLKRCGAQLTLQKFTHLLTEQIITVQMGKLRVVITACLAEV